MGPGLKFPSIRVTISGRLTNPTDFKFQGYKLRQWALALGPGFSGEVTESGELPGAKLPATCMVADAQE